MIELKQQVRMLQAVAGYGAADGENGGGSVANGSLEVLLLDKNRRAEHELTMARLALSESRGLNPTPPHVKNIIQLFLVCKLYPQK